MSAEQKSLDAAVGIWCVLYAASPKKAMESSEVLELSRIILKVTGLAALTSDNERLQKLVDNKIDYANDMRIALNTQRSETDKWKRAYQDLDAHIKGCLV